MTTTSLPASLRRSSSALLATLMLLPTASAQGPGSFHLEGCPEWFAQWDGATPEGTSNTPAMAILDFDGDGDRDYAYLDPDPETASLAIRFWENRNGTLEYHSSFGDPGSFFVDIAPGDFDGDGHADVALTGFFRGTRQGHVRILAGDGKGGFTALPHVALPLTFADIRVADMDRDGLDDMVLSSYFDDFVAVVRGDGQMEEFPIAEGPFDFEIADLDGNGYPDLVHTRLANPAAFLDIRFNDGAGHLSTAAQVLGPFDLVYAARAGDVDGDGDNDLVLAETVGDPSVDEMRLTVLPNDGAGTFSSAVHSKMSDLFWPATDLQLCDLDGDEHLDVVFSCVKTDFAPLGIVVTARGAGDGHFERLDMLPLVVHDLSLETGVGGALEIWTSRGRRIPVDGAGRTRGHELTRVRPRGSSALLQGEAVDLDRDSIDDFVYYDPGTGAGNNPGAVEVHYGDGEGAFRDSFFLSLGQPFACQGVRRANLDGDGWPDLVVIGTDRVIGLLGDGTGGLLAPRTTTMRPCDLGFCASFATAVGDLDGDGRDDLVLNDKRARDCLVALGTGDGGFAPSKIQLPEVCRNLALEDLDGSGSLDLALVGIETGRLFVLPGSGDGTFGPARATPLDETTMAYLTAGDVDQDGDVDLVLASHPSGFLVLENDGRGAFSHGQSVHETMGLQEMRIEDMNGDGWPDLVGLSRILEKTVIFYENRRGQFLPGSRQIWELTDTHYVVISQYSSPMNVFVGDFDGDRLKDLGVTTTQIDPAVFQASVYFNRTNLHATGSARPGGEITLSLHAPACAKQPYLLLASTQGTWPGIHLADALLPLNPDPALWSLIWSGGHGLFVDFKGVLDAEGDARAVVNVPPSLSIPPGTRIDLAFACLDVRGGSGIRTSNSVPIRFQ